MPYIYERRQDVVDLLIEKRSRYEVTIDDGAAGDSDDYYGIAINEKGMEDELRGGGDRHYNSHYEDQPDHVYRTAFVEDDPNPGSDDSSTIASNLETQISNSTKPVTTSVSGGTITIEADDKDQGLHVEVFSNDEQGNIVARRADPEAYELHHASNWDGNFSSIETIPQTGTYTVNAGPDPAPTGAENASMEPWVRYRFAPQADHAIDNGELQFFKVAPVIDGVTQSTGPIFMVLPRDQLFGNHPPLVLRGDAPKAADSDGALELQLPYQTTSIYVQNIDSNALTEYISFGSGKTEIPLGQSETFSDNKFGSWNIAVRTDSGASSAGEILIYVTINRHSTLA